MIITSDIEQIIKQNVISKQYPKLNSVDTDLLYKYFSKVVEVFLLVNNYAAETDFNKDLFLHEFIQNDSQSLKWLCSFLLPYINSDVSTSSIESLNDIYLKRKSTELSETTSNDLTKVAPSYLYSNIQYGRCTRSDTPIEISFSEEHLKQNALLLCTSIIESSNKFYVNWMDLMPYTINNYIDSQLFKNTKKIFEQNKLSDTITSDLFNKITLINNSSQNEIELFGSLYIGDIYMCIRNYLYEDIVHIKILIYDMGLEDINDKVIPAVFILSKIMPLFIKNALNNNKFDQLLKENKLLIASEFESLQNTSQHIIISRLKK